MAIYGMKKDLIGDYINNDYEGIESAWFSGKQLADWLTFNESKEA